MSNSLVLDTQRPWELVTQCPAYQATPLREISTPGGYRLLIKDETNRFNLGAFKALGGIYAVAAYLLKHWEQEMQSPLDPQQLFDNDVKDWSKRFTFVCASAGNHGMAVAKAAQLFNANSRIHLADTVPLTFEQKLKALGAIVVRSGATYEDSMEAAKDECESAENSYYILLADSSWPGYTELPTLVMEGYTVMAEEMRMAFKETGNWPSHVFLQAGVGGLAAAIAFHIRQHWDVQPKILIVEPHAAPCLGESHKFNRLITVNGPVSNMGRLDCKEPSMLAFESLQHTADTFICISDAEAEQAAQFLASKDILTTPSGAAGVATVVNNDTPGITLTDIESALAIVTEGPI